MIWIQQLEVLTVVAILAILYFELGAVATRRNGSRPGQTAVLLRNASLEDPA